MSMQTSFDSMASSFVIQKISHQAIFETFLCTLFIVLHFFFCSLLINDSHYLCYVFWYLLKDETFGDAKASHESLQKDSYESISILTQSYQQSSARTQTTLTVRTSSTLLRLGNKQLDQLKSPDLLCQGQRLVSQTQLLLVAQVIILLCRRIIR